MSAPVTPEMMKQHAADLKAWLDARGLTIVANLDRASCWLGLADPEEARVAGYERCDAYAFGQRARASK